MPVKIRLARRGRKFAKIYSIVVADSRAPRDGKYIDTLGLYNPNTNPASISLDFEKSLDWLQKGAQPTETCKAILSYKGVLFKKHLLEGVKKGAFDEAEAEKRFEKWQKEKEGKIQAKVDRLSSETDAARKERIAAEIKVNEERAVEIQKQRAKLLEKAAGAVAEDVAEEVEEDAGDDPAVVAEELVAEEVAAEVAEPVEEVKAEEAPKAEPVEEVKAEETPAEDVVEEVKAEETPAAEADDTTAETKEESSEEEKK